MGSGIALANEEVTIKALWGRQPSGTATITVEDRANPGVALLTKTKATLPSLDTIGTIAYSVSDRVLDYYISIDDPGSTVSLEYVIEQAGTATVVSQLPSPSAGSRGKRRGRAKGITFSGLDSVRKTRDEIIGHTFIFDADVGSDTIQTASISGADATIAGIDDTRVYAVIRGLGAVTATVTTVGGSKLVQMAVFHDPTSSRSGDYCDH